MFHLTKILNGRANVPECERVSLFTEVTVPYGTPVSIRGGTLTVTDGSATALPTHIVLADALGEDTVLAAPITGDMIFEVPVTASPASMAVGTEYLLSANGTALTATAASSGKRGATLVEKMGAVAAGDLVRVAFRN